MSEQRWRRRVVLSAQRCTERTMMPDRASIRCFRNSRTPHNEHSAWTADEQLIEWRGPDFPTPLTGGSTPIAGKATAQSAKSDEARCNCSAASWRDYHLATCPASSAKSTACDKPHLTPVNEADDEW